jgi:hypothetical protein
MTDAWAPWYRGLDGPQPYGEVTSYHIAADFLADCETVEDWGCGKGYFSTLRPDVLGVDGTKTPFSDVVTDLKRYRSEADGVLLRHVLEHNYGWQFILDNAIATARKKLCIILFTPCTEETFAQEIAFTEELGVPDISFSLEQLKPRFHEFAVTVEHIKSNTQYGEETIIRATRATR